MLFLETLTFLISTVGGLFVLVLLLRFYLQLSHAPHKHPLNQFVMAVTNFVVLPLRRRVPSWHGYDSASILVALLVQLLVMAVVVALGRIPYNFVSPQTWFGLSLLALLELFRQSLNLLTGAVIVQAILSWVSPYNALSPILEALTRPYLKPFRAANVGGVDLSPLVLLLIIQVIQMLPLRLLEQLFLTQLKIAV
ncbi:YggT family protein [Vogesella sp. LIG4]|uniref:YggT family protein n=1 Tax=Vogesella sp. LIG4 TaxID=1192162 RepID=UPI00081FD216|nr:YggT family protein [Vogesella sp. LIG4]SCK13013.1 YggT family protein [Vogesella sp. LIG4]